MAEHLRWLVEIDYLTDNGLLTIDHHIEGLDEVAELVEAGPDWNAIKGIRIQLNPQRATSHDLTVEQLAAM